MWLPEGRVVDLRKLKIMNMKSMITVNDKKSICGGDVFYGNIRINGKDVSVSNHLKSTTKKYDFRYITKCRAGFQIIVDANCTVEALVHNLGKHCAGVEVKIGNHWFHVMSFKGGKWVNIDKGILEVLTVGDMHQAFTKMVDWDMWKQLNTKTWASKAFVYNA